MTQYKVYKGFPYSFTAKKARYYNITGSGIADDNTTLSYEMTPYAGLDTTVEYIPTATTTSTDTADVDGTITLPYVEPEIVYTATASTRNLVTIAEGELPDYSTYTGGRYCLGTTGANYLIPDEETNTMITIASGLAEGLTDDGLGKDYNMFYKDGDVVFDTDILKSGYAWVGKFTMPPHQIATHYQPNYTVTGSLTIGIDYTISGFSASNYLISTQSILTGDYFTTPYEIVARFNVTDVSSTQEIYFDNSSNNHGVGIYGYKLRAWVGGAYYGSTTLSTNTWYWVKTVYDGATSTVYLSTDGETWSTEITYTGSIFGTNAIRFGNGYQTTTEYLRGQLDLTSLKITTADTSTQTVWTALK
jgi:hypothetical protein